MFLRERNFTEFLSEIKRDESGLITGASAAIINWIRCHLITTWTFFKLNVDKNVLVWSTYQPHFVHVVIEWPLSTMNMREALNNSVVYGPEPITAKTYAFEGRKIHEILSPILNFTNLTKILYSFKLLITSNIFSANVITISTIDFLKPLILMISSKWLFIK